MKQTFSNDELKELEDLGKVFFSIDQVAKFFGKPVSVMTELLKDENNQEHVSYYKGLLSSEFELRNSIVKLAKQGSSPAQAMAMDLLNKTKMKLLDR